MENNTQLVYSGIHMGEVLAMILSYSVNKSILWAILHGFCSWIYVIYYAVTYSGVGE